MVVRYIRQLERARRIAHIRHVRQEARQYVNLTECGGRMWVRLGGVPVIAVDRLTGDVYAILEEAREMWVRHTLEKEGTGL